MYAVMLHVWETENNNLLHVTLFPFLPSFLHVARVFVASFFLVISNAHRNQEDSTTCSSEILHVQPSGPKPMDLHSPYSSPQSQSHRLHADVSELPLRDITWTQPSVRRHRPHRHCTNVDRQSDSTALNQATSPTPLPLSTLPMAGLQKF